MKGVRLPFPTSELSAGEEPDPRQIAILQGNRVSIRLLWGERSNSGWLFYERVPRKFHGFFFHKDCDEQQ